MNLSTLFGLAAIALLLVGCATPEQQLASQKAYYEAQSSFAKGNVAKPACSFEAKDGESMEFKGLKKLECFGSGGGQQAFTQYVEPESMGLKLLDKGLTVFGMVKGAQIAADGAVGLVRAAGGIAKEGFKAVTETSKSASESNVKIAEKIPQPPSAPNITTTTINKNVNGTGSIDSNGNVATTAENVGGNGSTGKSSNVANPQTTTTTTTTSNSNNPRGCTTGGTTTGTTTASC